MPDLLTEANKSCPLTILATPINATDVVIKVGDVVVGCAQSADFTVSREMNDATCAASGGWSQFSPGQKSWNGSIGAIYREFTAAETATNFGFDDIFDLLDEGTLVTVEYTHAMAGITSPTRYSGEAYVSEVKWSKPDKGPVTWSGSFAGSGAIGRV